MSNTTVTNKFSQRIEVISTAVMNVQIAFIFQWIVFTILCQSIALFGVGSNVVSLICFAKQGFQDPVNISLFGLAISDIGCLVTLMFTSLCVNPAFRDADLPFETFELPYLVSGIPHTTFTRITAWITGLITLERCLCIIAPLQVKRIVTPKRVSIIISFVYISLISAVAPVYMVNKLDIKYFPALNKSLLGLVFTEDHDQVERISYIVNNVCIPFSAFILITICTIVLSISLKKTSKWRKTSASSLADHVSNRNQKVAKMVVMISALFIVCFVPFSIIFLVMTLVPGFSMGGEYIHMLIIMGGLGFLLESINSSMNIFIYYHMSSRYRLTFSDCFRRCLRQKNNYSM